MNNLMDIQNQIEKLQKQAADIKAKEFDRTVQEIRRQMEAFGITVKDLQPSRKTSAGRPPKTGKRDAGLPTVKRGPKSGSPVAAKYAGPNGETWSGRGLQPRWLASLVLAGRSKEEFAIEK